MQKFIQSDSVSLFLLSLHCQILYALIPHVNVSNKTAHLQCVVNPSRKCLTQHLVIVCEMHWW